MFRLQQQLPGRYRQATAEELAGWIAAAKAALGERLLVLGHHYQRDEVMAWADARGDSLALARLAASRPDAELIVFCGVHFMAESADVVTGPHQQVVLPDLNAGCSMADMADVDEVEAAWEDLATVTDVERIIPITYINSSAALKAFVGRHGGAVCTSSNARAVLAWALGDGPPPSMQRAPAERPRGDKVLFFPDQHLGRNTGYQMGWQAHDMAVWDPRRDLGGLDERTVKDATLLLWRGHCSVHQRFRPEHVAAFRAEHPDGLVFVHPECAHEVVEVADQVGSTDFIIRAVAAAPTGSVIAVGTEIHLVHRLAAETPDKTVVSLDPLVCPCATMFRIDAAHLAWILDGLVDGEVRNRIVVDPDTATWAKVALERMLAIS
ncbi:MAG: quinolinate synthase NadA [Actinomycetota bacterium]|jgi:quinolinate synthase|nr:quinolinate synthase NadA [Actinomycetota bacterium]